MVEMVEKRDMYKLVDRKSHLRKELSRDDTIKYIKGLTGLHFDIGESLTVSTGTYHITVKRI